MVKKNDTNGDNYDTADGTTIRDYIHVSDLAEIHYMCVKDLIKNKSKILTVVMAKVFQSKKF